MIKRKEYTQQAVTRVFDFGKRHADLFPSEAATGELLDELERDMNTLAEHSSGQVSGDGAVQKSLVCRDAARRALQFKLKRMDQTARALKLPDFFIPRSRSDKALIKAGNAFAKDAEPLKAEFINHGLSADFIEQLKAAVQDLDSATRNLAKNVGKRKATITSFDSTLKKALDDLARFDAMVANTLSDNPEIMAEWKHARRVGRPPVRAKKNSAAQPETSPSPPHESGIPTS